MIPRRLTGNAAGLRRMGPDGDAERRRAHRRGGGQVPALVRVRAAVLQGGQVRGRRHGIASDETGACAGTFPFCVADSRVRRQTRCF